MKLEDERLAQTAAERLTLSALEARDARDREAAARAESERRQQELDALFASLTEPVLAFDLRGRIEASNRAAAALLGRELDGHTCEELAWMLDPRNAHGDPVAQERLPWARALRGEVVLRERLRIRVRGEERAVLCSGAPMQGGGHVPSGGVVVITDVTELDRTEAALRESEAAARRAEERLRVANEHLREADQRKDEFLGMLSHELRNPLAPIRSAVYVLRHALDGDQARRAQDVIERQTGHLARLVDDLLDVTRIARGKIQLRRERVDLRETVLRAAEDFRLGVEGRGVEFRTELPDGPVWTSADPTRLAQVVGNLLHNAAKFTGPGDAIVLSLGVAEAEAEIRVRDTGEGIDPELLPRLFEPFVQGSRALARTEGGLGLGLALVKGVAELHGGTASVRSDGRGRGAELTVRLPLVGPGEAQRPVPAAAPAAGRVRHVLVVDDNVDAAESLAGVVELLGHEVEVATDGPSAVEKVRQSHPDVVLCDIGLPGMDGYEVARAVRGLPGDHVELVAVTGYAQPDDVRRAAEAGYDHHVAKPPDPAQIERLLR